MSRFRSTKRAKELSRKAHHEAKEARKRERRLKANSGEVVDDIDWSQAVGFGTPPEMPSEDESATPDDTQWGQTEDSPPEPSGDEGNGVDPDPVR